MQNLYIPRLERHGKRQFFGKGGNHFKRLGLLRREPGKFFETLGAADVLALPARHQFSVHIVEHGQRPPGIFAFRYFAAPVPEPGFDHLGGQIGPARNHLVVDRDGTDEIAFAARTGCLQAEQGDHIAGIRMPRQVGAGVISAMRTVVEIAAGQVFDMTQYMPLAVLRDGHTEPQPDPPIGDGRLMTGIPHYRYALDQRDAAPVHNLPADYFESFMQTRQRKIGLFDSGNVDPGGLDRGDGGVQFRNVAVGQPVNPVVGCREVLRAPVCRIGYGLHLYCCRTF